MARIKCPLNVSSITLATSGTLTPDSAGVITCTAAEATALGSSVSLYNQKGAATLVQTDSSGNILIAVPSVITALTIAGTSYNVNGAVKPYGTCLSASVPPAAGSQFLYQNFSLVNG